MKKHKIGDAWAVAGTTSDDGGRVAADSTPTVTVWKNGSAVGALTDQAMTALATGRYRFEFSTASGFAEGDRVEVIGTAVLGGVTFDTLLDSGIMTTADVDDVKSETATLASRLSATRAGYLDKLNITGNVAGSAEVTAIQNNTAMRILAPAAFERPDSGSTSFRVEVYLYDSIGNMEAPDSEPTLAVTNQAGTDRSANLGAISNPATGHYRAVYTVADSHALESLKFEWSATEGGTARIGAIYTTIADITASAFTASDRNLLTDAAGDADTAATQASAANTKATAIQERTDNLPDSPAAVGSAMALAASTDVYWAKLEYVPGTSADQFTATWYKNGVIQTSVTSPTITVTQRDAGGTVLVAAEAMTGVGSTGAFFYDEADNRIAAGDSVLVDVTATIDGSPRTFRELVQRPAA